MPRVNLVYTMENNKLKILWVLYLSLIIHLIWPTGTGTMTPSLDSINTLKQLRNTQRYLRCSWDVVTPSMIKHLPIITEVG